MSMAFIDDDTGETMRTGQFFEVDLQYWGNNGSNEPRIADGVFHYQDLETVIKYLRMWNSGSTETPFAIIIKKLEIRKRK